MKIATVKEMREIDKAALDEYGIPEILLMENAGREAVAVLMDRFCSRSSHSEGVLAGRGNNGGDGLVAARYLREAEIAPL